MLKGGVVHETLSIRPPVAMLPVRRGVSRSPHAGHEAPFINESHIRIPLGKCPGKPLWQGLLIHPKIKEKHQPLYQKPVLNMANPVNYDTGDDAPCRAQQRVHLHPGACRAIMTLLLV